MVGRDADLLALGVEVERSRLVTIQGPPGVGKTRLSIELAREKLAAGEAVAVCDVTECATAADILVRVAGALHVDTTMVAERLATRPVALIIDNAEHIASEVAACVEAWLASARELRVVVTSRVRLRLPGEVVFDLQPLEHAAAVELYVDRARAARRGELVDAAAIGELVRRLEGMPLAIELTAARSRLYEPSQLLSRLGSSADLLHGSLGAALQMSFDLLAPAERRALAQTSVFRGGFTIDAAEAVIDLGGESVVDALGALVDHSLVWTRREGEHRRLGLYLVVRELAAKELDVQALAAVEARHDAYYLRAGVMWADERQMIGPHGFATIRRVATEAENLSAVYRRSLADPSRGAATLESAHALHPLFRVRGPIDHSIAILERGLAVAPADHPLRLTALERLANARRDANLGDANLGYDELERTATAAGSRWFVGRAYVGRGIVKLLQRDVAGEADIQAALDIQREQRDKFGEAISLASLGHLAIYRTDLAVAREHFARALALSIELGDARNAAINEGNLGRVEQECGRLEVAREAFERAREVVRTVDDRRFEAWTMGNLASVLQEQGALAEARTMYRATLVRQEEVGNRRGIGATLAQLARIDHWEGKLDSAHELYRRALSVLEAAGWTTRHALTISSFGGVLADLGLRDDARLAFERAEAVLRDDAPGLAALEVARGHLDLATGDVRMARRRAVDSLGHIDRWNVRFARIGLERALARTGVLADADGPADPSDALVIGGGARWFRTPGGAKVDLARRRPLRLILAALATARLARPGHALTVDALLADGWPGELVMPEAGASRVYVAVSTLRRMGLRDYLQRADDGYLIDPDARLVEAD
jgi:predicted ATPase/predicted negative regulator of RcsB-dependent stress response